MSQRTQKGSHSSNFCASKDDDTATTATNEHKNSNNDRDSLFSFTSEKNIIVGLWSKPLSLCCNEMCCAFVTLLVCCTLCMLLMMLSLSNLMLLSTMNSDFRAVVDYKTISIENPCNKTKEDSRIATMLEEIRIVIIFPLLLPRNKERWKLLHE